MLTDTEEQLTKELQGGPFKNSKTINKEQFKSSLLHFFDLREERDLSLVERMFELTDRDKNGHIDFEEYHTLLGLLFAKSSDDKVTFIFSAFDLNGDGMISRDEFTKIVALLWENKFCRHLFDFALDERNMVGIEVFVESFFKEADINKDGLVSFDEYRKIASKYAHKVTDHKLQILATQTGGHVNSFRKLDGGKIMKVVNKIECLFYTKVDQDYTFIKSWIPNFYGTKKEDEKTWIVIEDLTNKMQKPCVMDIKMGTTSAGEDAVGEKKEEMLKKDYGSTTVTLGMRITGMKVYDEKKQENVQYTKSWGRKVTVETMTESLLKYFDLGTRVRVDVLGEFLKRLKTFQQWMESQNKLRFYSSSLLFVYDATNKDANVHMRMIDFAHVFPINENNGRDDGYITGIRNLISHFEKIQSKVSNH